VEEKYADKHTHILNTVCKEGVIINCKIMYKNFTDT